MEVNMKTRLVIASDHGGLVLKARLVPWLETQEYEILDQGAYIYDAADDYPDYAEEVAEGLNQGKADKGILICGSGVGACIALNKIRGIRAGVCHDTYSAHQGVEHDDMNVLCLGGRVIGIELAKELITAFIKARYLKLERFERRVQKVRDIEKRNS
jgi:ribose 5-phosphate isomerase B